MKFYYPEGHYFEDENARIIVECEGKAKQLPFASGKARHSPDGFSWGYNGSGPAELARAILADFTGNPDPPTALYQEFKRVFIASKRSDSAHWIISGGDIQAWLDQREEGI